jgi:HK97 family phage portal protein
MFDWLRRTRAGQRHGIAREAKSGFPLIAFQGPGEAVWTGGGRGALAAEGFARNPVVYRCVRMIGEAAASLPLLLYDGEAELAVHPLLDLLAAPNPRQSRQAFMEALYGHLMVSGNAYVQPLALDGAPRELHLLSPDRVEPVADESGWPFAYDYTAGNRRQRIDAGEDGRNLLHLALFNPGSDHEGLPPLAAAHMALDIHNAASRWNKALLDNSARPSGALVYTSAEGMNLTQDQFERLKTELEQGYSGAGRAGRPMLLEGGLDWKAMAYSPRDMDFIEARNGAARDIALAFGVPPMLLGIPGDNTYSNYQEANRVFWRQTILPLATRVVHSLGGWLAMLAAGQGERLRLDIDRDAIEALSPDREALWKRVGEAAFLTTDEKRSAVGYGPAEPGFGGTGPGDE